MGRNADASEKRKGPRAAAIPVVVLVGCAAVTASVPAGDYDDSGNASVSFELINEYAESIFTVSYTVPDSSEIDGFSGEPSGVIADGLRLDAYESHTVDDVFSAPEGTPVIVEFVGRSLGEDNSFPSIELEIGSLGICTLRYEYDLANATFSVGHGCD